MYGKGLGSAIARPTVKGAVFLQDTPRSLWQQPRLTTSTVASRIASPPTSSSGLSRPSQVAIGNFCRQMHRRRTYYLYCTLIYALHYCHINLSKNANPNLIVNPNMINKKHILICLTNSKSETLVLDVLKDN